MTKKRGMKKRKEFFFILAVLLAGILFLVLSPVNAEESSSYFCAERTTNGLWCMNVPWDEVNTNYDYTQTSCEATSFCKAGTCVNGIEGSCRPNVPEVVCDDARGIWKPEERDEIPQCQLGCCYIGSGASFVTQTKCTSQASRYGVEISFDPSIRDPIQCIASAYPEEEGACVTDDGFVRHCKRTTSQKCEETRARALESETVEFHKGTLCTAAHLETECVPTENYRTKLEPDRDEVFFEDSCGNTANIYDSKKKDEQAYWDYIVDKKDSCDLSSDLRNADVCGNCNYLEGSIGKRYDRGNSQMFSKAPNYGDYICADLGCEYEGEHYEHGESWCGTSVGSEDNLPGSEHFKFKCDYGEVNIEQGKPFRGEICIDSEIPVEGQEEGFKVANFRANLWTKCVLQDNQEDCEDIQERDCMWVNGTTLGGIHADEDGIPLVVDEDGELVPREDEEDERIGAACVPKYPPALWFWESNTTRQQTSQETAAEICFVGSQVCVVKFEDPYFFGATTCVENCHCLGLKKGEDPTRMKDGSLVNIKLDKDNEWIVNSNKLCIALGDCGASENYIGEAGHWELEDLVEVTELKEE